MAKKEKQVEKALKFVMKGHFDKAIAEYKSIVAANPADISLRLRLGELYVKTGLKEEAIKEYSSIGKYNTTKGFYLKAIAVYKLVIKLDEPNLDIHNKLADLYTKQRLIADAIGEYSFILNTYEKKGYSNEAFDLLKKMVGIDEENAGLKLRLADMQKKLGYEDDALDLYCWVVQKFLAKGKSEKAENLLRDLYADYPKDMRVLEGLVNINKERGDVSQFVSHASELIDSYKECGELEKVEVLCESVLEAAPDNEKAKSMLDGLRGEVESSHEVADDEDEVEEAVVDEVLEDSASIEEPLQEASLEGSDAGKEEEAEVEDVLEDAGEPSSEVSDVSQESPPADEVCEEEEEEVDIDIDMAIDDEPEPALAAEQSDDSEELFDVDFDDFDDDDVSSSEAAIDTDGDNLPKDSPTEPLEEATGEETLTEAASAVEDDEPVVEAEPIEEETATEPDLEEVEVEPEVDVEFESEDTEDTVDEVEEVEVAEELSAPEVEEEVAEDLEEDLEGTEEVVLEDKEEPDVEDEDALEVVEVSEVGEVDDEDAAELSGELPDDQLEEISKDDVTDEEAESGEDSPSLEEVEVVEVLESETVEIIEELLPEDVEEIEEVVLASQSDPEDVGGAGAAEQPEQEFSEEEVSLSGDYTDESLARDNEEAGAGRTSDGLIDLTEELGIEEALGQLVDSWSETDSGDAVVEEFKVGMGEQLSREDVETHFNLGIAYMEMELLEDALREFKLSAKDPLFEFNSYARLGQCSVALDKAVDAVGFYIKALAVKGMSDTERIGAMYELAMAYNQNGENSEALQMMTAVSNLEPGYREVSEKLVEFAVVRSYIPMNDNLIEIELL